jgi:hypothetical protein
MFFDWIGYTVLIFIIVYLLIMLNYNKALYKREMEESKKRKGNVDDSKLMIRKYRVQLQRSIGNIDILTEELKKVRNDMKTLRGRNSQNKLEFDQLRH